jgi:hypothetical protein
MVVRILINFFSMAVIAFPVGTVQTVEIIQARNSSEVLNRKVSGNEIESLTTINALSRALASTSVPGGIVRIVDCTQEPVIQRWQPGGAPLSNILDTIVLADPQYRWQFDNGVINVLPTSNEPDFLKVRIKKFRVRNVTSVTLAYSKLMLLPEIKKAVIDLGLGDSFERLQGPPPLIAENTGFDVDCQDVTLREALNAIVRAEGKAVWTYSESHCNERNGFIIEFVVR